MNRHIHILAVLISLLYLTHLWAQPTTTNPPESRQVRRILSEQDMNRLSSNKPTPERLMDDIESRISALETEQKALIGELQAIKKLVKEGKTKEAVERIETFIKNKQELYEKQLVDLRRRLASMKKRSQLDERRTPVENIAASRVMPFTGKDFFGKQVSLSDYKGKVIVLEWMNPQCPFSNHFYKNNAMVNLAQKYQDKGVVWLAINSTHYADPEEMKAFIKEHNVPYPILDDREGKIGRLYHARTTPHMYIINRQGIIVYNGAIDSAGNKDKTKPVINYVEQALEELLDNKTISISYKKPYGCTVKYAQ